MPFQRRDDRGAVGSVFLHLIGGIKGSRSN
jgi:hypothetical protein